MNSLPRYLGLGRLGVEKVYADCMPGKHSCGKHDFDEGERATPPFRYFRLNETLEITDFLCMGSFLAGDMSLPLGNSNSR
jgi:hypothetical protein